MKSDAVAMDRRRAMKILGAVTLAPLLPQVGPGGVFALSGHHPLVPVQEGDEHWKAALLDEQQVETVAVLTDLILPRTDTPGARDVKVYQHVDYALSQESPAAQADFLSGLEWLDRRSRLWFGSPFAQLDAASQSSILTVISSHKNTALSDRQGVSFFHNVKKRTILGYYTSEAGMFEELDYQGNDFLNEFKGCQHPEHLQWEPS